MLNQVKYGIRRIRRHLALWVWPHSSYNPTDYAFLEALLGLDRSKGFIDRYNAETEEFLRGTKVMNEMGRTGPVTLLSDGD